MAETENKKKKSGFLEEDNGVRSSMRLMSMISLGASIMFGVLTLGSSLHDTLWGTQKNAVSSAVSSAESDTAQAKGNTNGLILTAMFLVGAFAPKAVQKFAEQKIGPVSTISKKSDPQ